MFNVGDRIRIKKCSPECTCFEYEDSAFDNAWMIGKTFRIIEVARDPAWHLGPDTEAAEFHVDDVFVLAHKGLGRISNPAHLEIFT